MRALEFEAKLDPEAKLRVPDEIAMQIPKEEPLRVIVLMAEGEDSEWRRLTEERFLRGFSDADSIYDEL